MDRGVYAWEERWTIAVSPRTTLLLELSPAASSAAVARVDLPTGLLVQKAFLTLDEVIERLEREDLWPAMPLPGRDNMPSF